MIFYTLPPLVGAIASCLISNHQGDCMSGHQGQKIIVANQSVRKIL